MGATTKALSILRPTLCRFHMTMIGIIIYRYDTDIDDLKVVLFEVPISYLRIRITFIHEKLYDNHDVESSRNA